MQKWLKNRIYAFIGLLLLGVPILSSTQTLSPAMEKVLSFEVRKPEFENTKTSFLFTGSKNVFIRYNPVSLLFGSMMYVYQGYFSKQFSSSCLYSPTCSNMSKHLIQDFGIVKGVFLSADRLSRCNRLAAAQIHPMHFDPLDGKVYETTDIYRFKAKTHKAHEHE